MTTVAVPALPPREGEYACATWSREVCWVESWIEIRLPSVSSCAARCSTSPAFRAIALLDASRLVCSEVLSVVVAVEVPSWLTTAS